MAGRIISFFCTLLCAAPFYLFARFSSGRKKPLPFWSGSEDELAKKVKDIPHYNEEMASLYKKYALSYLINAVLFALYPFLGVAGLIMNCTVGVYLMWQGYNRILLRYS